jgi:type I restriction enzyme M protein
MSKLPDPFSTTKKSEEQIGLTREIIDKIFHDPNIKYGLKEFAEINIGEVLDIFEKEKERFYIRCLKRDKDIFVFDGKKNSGKPEEIIRQLWLYKLVSIYKYPLDRIEIEYPVWFGSKVEKRPADIVVFYKNKDDAWIVGEIKKPNRKDGLKQLKSYLYAEGAPVGFWSNGQSHIYLFRPWPKESISLLDLPKEWESIEDLMGRKFTLYDLEEKIKEEGLPNLKELLVDLEDLVLARRSVDVFEEAFKLIFAKLYDEWAARHKRQDSSLEFRIKAGESPDDLLKRMLQLFHESIERWPGIFERDEREIKIKGKALETTVSHLQNTILFETELSVVDEAFEYLVNKVYKGEKGQYFTPRHVIKMCIQMLNPSPSETILDPAAGSGGFLILTMFYVRQKIKEEKDRTKYASESLYGIDFDEKAQKASKAIMLIAGDGSSNIYRLNSLEPWTWKGEIGFDAFRKFLLRYDEEGKDKENLEELRNFKFDVVLTNPPFAGDIDERETLRFYEIARKNNRLVNKLGRHFLFLERCLEFLRSSGRLAIILPQGVLNNTTWEYVREWVMNKARILAVVGLHINTFKPHTGTKTSVLFLQKWPASAKASAGKGGDIPEDYPIFMAVSKKPGKNNSGEYVYKKDEKGTHILDEKGRRILDHDLDDIAEAFIKFAKQQKFNFWE